MRARSSRGGRAVGFLAVSVAVLGFQGGAAADVVHLKNGGTIVCDRIEERGDDLVVHQGRGTIVVPRREVSRIEKTSAVAPGNPPGSTPGRAAPGGGATGGSQAIPSQGGDGPVVFDRAETLRRIGELKKRLEQFPLARQENRGQIAALLSRVGEEDLQLRHPEDARRRFEEALAHESGNSRAMRGLAAAHLELGQDTHARSVLERALLATPGDPDLLFLLGVVAQRQDRQAEALAVWERSHAARPDPALRERIETLRRQAAIEEDYRRVDAVHFTLRYDGERTRPDLEADVLQELEGRFPELLRQFDHEPSLPIAVVIYPDRAFYDATLADSNVAGLYDGKIRLPAGGLRTLNAEARAVLLHELAHAFITDKSRGRAPRWLQEGLAQWIEGRRTTKATSRELAGDWERCCSGSEWGPTFTYASALSFVEFLLDREGIHGLNLILLAMGRGLDPPEAIRAVTRFSLSDLTRQWGEDLARRHLQ